MIFGRFIRRRVRWRPRRSAAASAHFLTHKEKARIHIQNRLAYWNTFYNFQYGRIAIRNQTSRWGSCSKKGNLNFNYRIIFLSEALMDYVIVHELCHLKEFNHSQNFWNLVAQAMPAYKKLRSELRSINIRTLSQTPAS